MDDKTKKPDSPRVDRLRTMAAIAGILLPGPVALVGTVCWFLKGVVPNSRYPGGIDVADHPLLFYFEIAVFGAFGLLMTCVSAIFIIGYVRRRRSRR